MAILSVGGIRSQTRQNACISSGVPMETRMYLASAGYRGPMKMLFFLKRRMTCQGGRMGFTIAKFVCESIARSIRALTWFMNS